MNPTNLIKRAILSEKSYGLMEKGTYTFLVTKGANKSQIKKAVERQFPVKVVGIKVLSKSAKTKKISGTRKTAKIPAGKKALVTLQKGQSIALFSTKSAKSASQEKKGESKTRRTDSKVENKETNKGKSIFGKFRKSKNKEEEIK